MPPEISLNRISVVLPLNPFKIHSPWHLSTHPALLQTLPPHDSSLPSWWISLTKPSRLRRLGRVCTLAGWFHILDVMLTLRKQLPTSNIHHRIFINQGRIDSNTFTLELVCPRRPAQPFLPYKTCPCVGTPISFHQAIMYTFVRVPSKSPLMLFEMKYGTEYRSALSASHGR